jgi:hypothetical protein
MPEDYVPRPDDKFDTFQAGFIGYVNGHKAELGVTNDEATALTAKQTAWAAAYATHTAAQTAAKSATTAKEDARSPLESSIRSFAGRFQASESITDAQREAMEIPVHATTRTRVGVPTTRPIATVDTSRRLSHVIDFRDEDKPRSKAKPAGVAGCEIWVKVGGAPPADPSELRYVATDTATPYLAEYLGADAGKTAHYWLRWLNTRGEPGPWSDTVSATIPG